MASPPSVSSLILNRVKPVYKNDDPFDKTNHRPVSILPVLSTAFECGLYDKIYEYIDTILSKVQCGSEKVSVRNAN